MATVAEIEDKLLETVRGLRRFSTVESAGRKNLPDVYAHPATFIYWDGDSDAGSYPRPVDWVDFKVVVQTKNLAAEHLAAGDVYTLNDAIRNAIRYKTLGLANIEPFKCVSRRCTDYDDDEGMIEYTHTYRTRLSGPVVFE